MDEKTPNEMTETETPEVMAEVRSDTAETLELFNSKWDPIEDSPDEDDKEPNEATPSETSDDEMTETESSEDVVEASYQRFDGLPGYIRAKTALNRCLGDNPDWSRLFANNDTILNTHDSERGFIKPNAFKGCKKLKKVVIPIGITICSNAFKGTSEKLTIKFKGEKK